MFFSNNDHTFLLLVFENLKQNMLFKIDATKSRSINVDQKKARVSHK